MHNISAPFTLQPTDNPDNYLLESALPYFTQDILDLNLPLPKQTLAQYLAQLKRNGRRTPAHQQA